MSVYVPTEELVSYSGRNVMCDVWPGAVGFICFYLLRDSVRLPLSIPGI
jgi:hypothetical protein